MRVQQDHTYQSRQKTGSRRIYLPLELIQVNPFCCRGYRLRKKGPGYCHFPKDENEYIRGYDEDYFKGLTAEKQVLKYKKGRPYFVWELTGETKRNEPLDCRNYRQQ